MKRLFTLSFIAACSLAATSLSAQQQPVQNGYKREVPDSLVPMAKISEDSARAIALHRVRGMVQALELEREHGRLLYSWDIKVAGKPGITEVHVDAMNGKILAVEHETPKAKPAARRSS
jgi:uncharacterized membrane protein YkoI